MRMHPAFAIVLVGLAACSQADMAAKSPGARRTVAALACDTTTTPPPDSNFPRGFDYPQNVRAWVQTRDGDRTRLHAWCLFAGLNQTTRANGPLLWQSWKTSTQAFINQYNPWKGTDGAPRPARPAPLNARNMANARLGGDPLRPVDHSRDGLAQPADPRERGAAAP